MGLPYPDDEEPLPPGPKNETFTERLKRLGVDLHGMAKDMAMPGSKEPYGGELTRALAKRSLEDRPFKERLDAIFRGAADKREPGQEG